MKSRRDALKSKVTSRKTGKDSDRSKGRDSDGRRGRDSLSKTGPSIGGSNFNKRYSNEKRNGDSKSSVSNENKSNDKFSYKGSMDVDTLDETSPNSKNKKTKYPKKRKLSQEFEIEKAQEPQSTFMSHSNYNSDNEEVDNYDKEKNELSSQVTSMNRKTQKAGGFQALGLIAPLYKAIQHKGYKIPTPIQRRSIPVIMEGRDVVGMARTGSGKTAAFLIPMINKLKVHSMKVGVRGLILAPNRELALQTLKAAQEFCKYTDLRCSSLIGGESMEEQFATIASNPDIIIATPGRLMHLLIEMNLELKAVEYVVFDEADRLYELGFADQLREIIYKLPANRQTLLFSATLPRSLIDFARAGLTDPALIRLDVDFKMSQELKMYFFNVKPEEREASLLHILNNTLPKNSSTIIFVSTKYHVDYIHTLLTHSGIRSTYIYGALDQEARRINIARFRQGSVKVLVVTDVAARGLDIPLLDNVINYDFPSLPKVFLHRVGRTARAGNTGSAFSFITSDEIPYMLELQVFTGRNLVLGKHCSDTHLDYTKDMILGTIPSSKLDHEMELVASYIKNDIQMSTFLDAAKNGYKLYKKTRTNASKESCKKSKELLIVGCGVHPMFEDKDEAHIMHADILKNIASFRPPETIFEVGKRGIKSEEATLMKKRRVEVAKSIIKHHSLVQENKEKYEANVKSVKSATNTDSGNFKDSEFYMGYEQKDAMYDKGYEIQNKPSSFQEQAHLVSVDMCGDDTATLKAQTQRVWDSVKHKYVNPNQVGADNKKMIKTESGQLINASYRTDRFKKWQEKTRVKIPRTGETELSNSASFSTTRKYMHNKMKEADPNSNNSKRKSERKGGNAKEDTEKVVLQKKNGKVKRVEIRSDGTNAKSELKSSTEIIKQREKKSMRQEKNGRGSKGGSRGGSSSRGGVSTRGGSSSRRGASSRGGSRGRSRGGRR